MADTTGTTSSAPTNPPRFRSTARTQTEIDGARPKFSQTQRPTDLTALEKLRTKATAGIDPQFALTPLEDTEEQLQNTYNVTMRKQHFREILIQYDMIDVFTIYVLDKGESDGLMKHQNTNVPITYDLLQMHSSLSINTIREYMQFLRTYGQDYDLQNLEWSEELFKNSCEPSLRDKVVEQSLNIPENERGGPLLFFLAMQIITTASYDTTVAMVSRITNMKLTDFPGENVHQACSQLRSAYLRLSNLNALPPDLGAKLLKVMQTSSVDVFNGLFRQWENEVRLKTRSAADYESILTTAEVTYLELSEADEWSGVKSPGRGSAFKAGDDNAKCWKCNKPKADCSCPNRQSNWRRVPPTEGEPEVMERNGSKFYWCGKCRLWNKTHLTSQHVVGFKSTRQSNPGANLARGTNAANSDSSSSSEDSESSSDSDDDGNPQQYFSPFRLSEGESKGAFSSAICRGAQAFIAKKSKKAKKDKSGSASSPKSKKKTKKSKSSRSSSANDKKSKSSKKSSKSSTKSHHHKASKKSKSRSQE